MTSEQLAWKICRHDVEMTHLSGGSHIGAVLSVADIMAVLYADVLHYRPADPKWDGRDRLIMSKGHAGAALYAALAECGFFPVEELKTYYRNDSRLSGHISHKVPGVDLSTGSLGHGLGVAVGMAIAARQDDKGHRVFAILGDGECNEGSVWEAVQAGANFELGNLTAIVDHNHMQSLDYCQRTLYSGEMAEKWSAFGWRVIQVDGHDHAALRAALAPSQCGKPTVVIAHTVKGHRIPFMERDILWHYRFPHTGWEYDCAVNALHRCRPEGAEDIYTPNGIPCPTLPGTDADTAWDHTMGQTYHPTWYHLREAGK